MPVPVSTRLGPYQVLAPLGAGGMGEVYRALDTRLNREVALKVLPEAVASEPERMARFEREARLLAALNHPNIAAIHGLEDSNGKRAIVMELVEGPTLGERLSNGALPVADALGLASQVAEALEYAHDRGVIHRDLKPANIKITPEGRVKVLDFGLAKALDAEAGSSYDAASSPTLSLSSTRAGVLMGTAAYMSPEQARGQPSDKRADIWGSGAILYEMLTGQQAFPGETVSDTLASVLKSEPDWTLLPSDTPAQIRKLLRRCLERDRKLRLHDIGDAQLEIREALSGSVDTPVAAQTRPSGTKLWRLTTAMLALATVTLAILHFRTKPAGRNSEQLIGFRVTLPDERVLRPATHSASMAVSANGQRIAYVTGAWSDMQLFHRALGSSESTPVPSLRGDLKAPFLSPDGEWIGVFNNGKLKKVPVNGDPIETICDVSSGHGGTWNRQGLIVFTASHTSGLWSVSDRGGPIKALTTPKVDADEQGHYWPYFLPDDKTVLFTTIRMTGITFDRARIEVLRIDTGERRVLIEGGYAPRYLSSGYLVYARGGAIVMAPFDAAKLRVTGPAIKILDGVRIDPVSPPDLALSPNGVLVFVPGKMFVPESRFVLADRLGAMQDVPDITERYVDEPAFAPDGNRIAFSSGGDQTDVWIYDLRRHVLTRLTHDGVSRAPTWSPDGRQIAFVSNRTGKSMLVAAAADGSGEPVVLTTRSNTIFSAAFRPDARALAFAEYDAKTLFDIWLLDLEGDRRARPLLRTSEYEWQPRFAPNGQWLAYESSGASPAHIYIQAFDKPAKWSASAEGGTFPVWSSDGRELFFILGRALNVVQIRPGSDPAPGPMHKLFLMPGAGAPGGLRPYDVAPNGHQFVIVRGAPTPPPSNVFEVLVNWNPAAR